MAKKVNDVKDGDLKSNVVVLRSVYGKVGQKYFIQPQRDPKTGRFPECVKQVNSYGDIILTEDERNREAQGLVHFVPVTEVFTITDGKSFNLDDIYQAAEWEAIKNDNPSQDENTIASKLSPIDTYTRFSMNNIITNFYTVN